MRKNKDVHYNLHTLEDLMVVMMVLVVVAITMLFPTIFVLKNKNKNTKLMNTWPHPKESFPKHTRDKRKRK